MKIIATFLVVILMLLGGALWFLADGSLNEFVKSQIEKVGLSVTEQKVSVDTVDIRLTEGAGTIKGLKLPNPTGYDYSNAFTLGETTLDLNLSSLTKEPIIIDAVIIKAPEAFVQLKADGSSNIKDLIDIMNKNIGSNSAEVETSDSTAPEPKIAVTKVILENTNLTLDLTAFGNKAHKVTMPNIYLNNIGGTAGLPASELGSAIVKEALSAIWKEAKKEQEEALKDKVKEKLKDKAKEELGKLFGN
ncbi:AsmA family protein [Thalassotalea profundi]|uniref:AsmA domain-containing protein n=1 Tax=Thalassotalea profundi TaxID=2036687 RepID=A0ABQ3IEL5_9GAMM|nr:AsmA family protein [Thalassotalea profundi]GHE81600.1 hypothetical protein GCM10011501_07320 [Thalassotalea profundi]